MNVILGTVIRQACHGHWIFGVFIPGGECHPQQGGGLDGIVYAAGGAFVPTDLADVTPELVEEALGSVVRGLLFVAQTAASTLTEHGSIVVIGDVAGVRGWPSYLPHSAAKGAQRTLVSGLARALAPRHRIGLVHPGTVLPPDETDAEAL
jgi:NAD(P)-dependent dehydrogenase (short-subunit alcohol dehydrogenase family)